jgi:tripeptidyl-peptidase-1
MSHLARNSNFEANLTALYNITEGTTATKGNELGIFEDLGDYYSQTDLDLFFTSFYSYVHNSCLPSSC